MYAVNKVISELNTHASHPPTSLEGLGRVSDDGGHNATLHLDPRLSFRPIRLRVDVRRVIGRRLCDLKLTIIPPQTLV